MTAPIHICTTNKQQSWDYHLFSTKQNKKSSILFNPPKTLIKLMVLWSHIMKCIKHHANNLLNWYTTIWENKQQRSRFYELVKIKQKRRRGETEYFHGTYNLFHSTIWPQSIKVNRQNAMCRKWLPRHNKRNLLLW